MMDKTFKQIFDEALAKNTSALGKSPFSFNPENSTELNKAFSKTQPDFSQQARAEANFTQCLTSLSQTGLKPNPSAHRPQTRSKSHFFKERKPQSLRPSHTLNSLQTAAFYFINAWDLTPLSPGFTAQELKDSFRRLAKRLHPDQGGRNQDFRELQSAYAQLSLLFK